MRIWDCVLSCFLHLKKLDSSFCGFFEVWFGNSMFFSFLGGSGAGLRMGDLGSLCWVSLGCCRPLSSERTELAKSKDLMFCWFFGTLGLLAVLHLNYDGYWKNHISLICLRQYFSYRHFCILLKISKNTLA